MAILPEDPQARRNTLFGAVIVLLLAYASYDYLYVPRTAEIEALQQRLETLELQNTSARTISAGRGREAVEAELVRHRDQLVRVEGLIPRSEELPDLLDAISAEARRTGVDLSLIQPLGAQVETYYVRRTYDLAVLGSYHQIGQFLARIGSLPRIITPIDLRLSVQDAGAPGESPRLEARFAIETYVLPAARPEPAREAENVE